MPEPKTEDEILRDEMLRIETGIVAFNKTFGSELGELERIYDGVIRDWQASGIKEMQTVLHVAASDEWRFAASQLLEKDDKLRVYFDGETKEPIREWEKTPGYERDHASYLETKRSLEILLNGLEGVKPEDVPKQITVDIENLKRSIEYYETKEKEYKRAVELIDPVRAENAEKYRSARRVAEQVEKFAGRRVPVFLVTRRGSHVTSLYIPWGGGNFSQRMLEYFGGDRLTVEERDGLKKLTGTHGLDSNTEYLNKLKEFLDERPDRLLYVRPTLMHIRL